MKHVLIVLTVGVLLICPAAAAAEERRPDRDTERTSAPTEVIETPSEIASAVDERATDSGRTYPPALSPLNRSSEGLEIVVQPDGSKIADLEGRFQHATVVRILEDGSFSITCVDSHEHETKLLEEGASESAALPQEK